MNLFITDPKTKEQSVSLSMLVITFLAALVASGLQMAGKIESVGSINELFYASAGLYWSRKFTSSKNETLEAGKEESK